MSLQSAGDPRGRMRHVAGQAGWAAVLQVVGLALRYLVVVVIARGVGAEGLGLYTLALAFASGAALVGRVGLDRACVRFTARYRALTDTRAITGLTVFSTAITAAVASALAAVLFIGSDAIASAWGERDLAPVLRTVSIAVPAVALGEVWRDALRGFQDIRLAATLELALIPGASAVVLLIALAVSPGTATAPIVAATVAYWIAATIAGLRLRRDVAQLNAAPTLHPRAWLSFAAMLSFEGVLLFALQWADQLMLGYFLTADHVGQYAAAARVASLTAVPLLAVNMILAPTAANLHAAGRREHLRVTYARLTWATGAAGILLGITLVVAGRPVLSAFGEEFVLAYPVLVILAVAHMVNSATGSAGLLLGMTGHVRFRVINAGLMAVLNLLLNLLLIPEFGIVGAAIATASTLVLINVLQIIEVRFVLGFWGYDPTQLRYWVERIRQIRGPVPAK